MKIIELRSDTKTLPTEEMRRAMYEAEVGDDESGEDPTVNELERMAAEKLGKEAALLTSSGIMSNLIAVFTHAQRGDEIIVGNRSHIHEIEKGETLLAGVELKTLANQQDGQIDLTEIDSTVRSSSGRDKNISLLCLENTHNYCDGSPLTAEYTAAAVEISHRYDIPVHIDGARIFNASVALNTPVNTLTAGADSICFCLSKGLSCPIGSVLCGSKGFIEQARRWRKIIGGQMRQAGYIAAAGIVALDTMTDRLADDHENARRLALGLAEIPGIDIDPDTVKTNIVFFTPPSGMAGSDLVRRLDENGVRTYSMTIDGVDLIRTVTSRMVDSDDIDEALNRIKRVCIS